MSISVHNPGRRISESIWNVNTINLGECEKIVIYISPIFTIWPTQYWQKVIIWAPVRIVVSYSNAPLQTAHCSFCLSNFIIGPSRTTARLSQKASAYINNTNSVHTDPRFPSLLPTFLIRSCLNDGPLSHHLPDLAVLQCVCTQSNKLETLLADTNTGLITFLLFVQPGSLLLNFNDVSHLL